MRAGFVTCVRLGLTCIEQIYAVGGHLDLLVTLSDDQSAAKSGRIYLDELAERHSVPLLKVRNVNEPTVLDAVHEAELDWLFIIGWSQIAKPDLLAAPLRGVVGMHPTLLPHGRGRASIPWAILKSLPKTGVTLFKLDEGVDTGPIIAQKEIPLAHDETATTLYSKTEIAHVDLIQAAWPLLKEDAVTVVPQDESMATTWPARRPEDGRIVSSHMSTRDVDLLVRATTRPYPGAFVDEQCDRIRIWAGSTTKPYPDAPIRVVPTTDGYYFSKEWTIEPGAADAIHRGF